MTKNKESSRKEALAEYQKTRDIIRLQHQLGHKHIKLTLALLERSKLLGTWEQTQLQKKSENPSGPLSKMTREVISQKLGVYAMELGMRIASYASRDVSHPDLFFRTVRFSVK